LFDSTPHSAAREHTTTVALLALAFIFIPALTAVSQPFSYVSVSFAISGSAVCVILAWIQSRPPKVCIPAIANERGAAK